MFASYNENFKLFASQDPGPPPDYDTAVVIKKNNFFPNVIMHYTQYNYTLYITHN